MEHPLRITAGHLVTHHIVLLPLWKDWQFSEKNRLYSMNKFLSIPGMVFLLSFFLLYLQGLNQLVVSGLTKFLIY